MDERLEKALDFSKYQQTLQIQKNNLKLRLEHMLITKFEEFVFNCSMELINFIHMCLQCDQKSVIIFDVHKNPVKINDLKKCHDSFLTTYNIAYNEYLENYNKLKKSRNIKKVVS